MFKYRGALSLRDEIGPSPDIEVYLKRIITIVYISEQVITESELIVPFIRGILLSQKAPDLNAYQYQIWRMHYHTITLLDFGKLFCGILLYFGSASYVYQGLPMEHSATQLSGILV